MDAVVLCGGRGTRLGPLTDKIPKPLLPFDGLPFLDYLLQQIAVLPFERIVLLGGVGVHMFHRRYEGKFINGIPLLVVEDKECQGTLNAFKFAPNDLSENFFLFNGDTYFSFKEPCAFVKYFENELAHSTILSVYTESCTRYGKIETKDNLITSFFEKNSELNEGGFINSGIAMLKKSDIEKGLLMGGGGLEDSLYPALIASRELNVLHNRVCDFFDYGIPEAINYFEDFLKIKKKVSLLLSDRDNTLNRDEGYTYNGEDLVVCKNNIQKIHTESRGRKVVVISNQSGIGRKYFTESDSCKFYRALKLQLMKLGIPLWGYFYCPHVPDFKGNPLCNCRKPLIGLTSLMEKYWDIDWSDSAMVGDSDADKGASLALKIPFFKVECE